MGITWVERVAGGVEIVRDDGRTTRVDAVVLATHSDQALAAIASPTPDERSILGDITYTPNRAVLHTDRRMLPDDPALWASWNYRLDDCTDPDRPPIVTYLLNRLQRLDAATPYCVTLNAADIARERIIASMDYAHPRYSFRALRAQARLPEINGADRIWFAGAYHRHGFHEDGLRSGLAVAASLGARW